MMEVDPRRSTSRPGDVVGIKPAGGIRASKQAIQYLVHALRDARRRVDDARPLPLRRVRAPERRAHAAPQGADGALPVRRLLHDRTDGRGTRSATCEPARDASSGTYAPAPEARDIVSSSERYGLFIGGDGSSHGRASGSRSISPATEEQLAEVAERERGGRRPRRRRRARRASRTAGRSSRRSERGEVPVPASPGCIQERVARARRRRVARRRKADPASRATSTSRSRRRTSSTTRAGPTSSSTRSRAARRGRSASPAQILALELPAADGPRGRSPRHSLAGNTVVLKPAETTPLTAMLFAELCGSGPAPPGVVEPGQGSGEDGGPSRGTGHRQGRVHRLDRRRKAHHARARGPDVRLTLELGGKAANIVFDDARSRPGGRGHRQRHLLQPGPRMLRRLAPPRAGVDLRAALDKLKRPPYDAPRRRPARQEHRRRAINSKAQLEDP